MNKKDKLDKVLEGYKPIAMKRLFYPRKMNLSEDFVNAFHREYDRLVGEGQNPKSLIDRFGKALKFHVNETRKYRQLDEKGTIDPKTDKPDMTAHDAAKERVEKRHKSHNPSPAAARELEKQKGKKLSKHGKNVEKWSKDQS